MIQWQDKYNIGIKEIDKQHKQIVSILNEIYYLKDEEDVKAINSIFNNLKGYILKHFSFEEQYIRKYNYPGIEEQEKEHHQFIEKFSEIESNFLKYRKITAINIFNFVWDWFSKHVLGTDKKLALFK